MKGFKNPFVGLRHVGTHYIGHMAPFIGRFSTLRPTFNLWVQMFQVRNPTDIIADELWDHEDPEGAAEDVQAALNENGWYLVYTPADAEQTKVV